MTSGGRLEAWFIVPCMQFTGSAMPPDVIIRRSSTRPSQAFHRVIRTASDDSCGEGLGTRLLSYNVAIQDANLRG